jgi:microcystin-dependent protein
MQLPTFKTAIKELSLLQTKWKSILDPLLKSSQGGFIPTGVILAFGGTVAPAGFLLCDGSAYKITAYPALAAVLLNGTNNGWGAPKGDTFVVPDMRGRVIVGAGQGSALTKRTVGQTGGEETHVLTTPEMPSHTHTQNAHNHGLPIGAGGSGLTSYNVTAMAVVNPSGGPLPDINTTATNQNTGGGGAHNNMQPFAVATAIIKT